MSEFVALRNTAHCSSTTYNKTYCSHGHVDFDCGSRRVTTGRVRLDAPRFPPTITLTMWVWECVCTDTVTSISIVALGTSLPDTFASMLAISADDNADNAIGNVTGSNSVNVFLGLGLPWIFSSLYWASTGGPTGTRKRASHTRKKTCVTANECCAPAKEPYVHAHKHKHTHKRTYIHKKKDLI